MKILKNISLILLVLLTFASCEEVIILDLENDEPQLVIEAVVNATDKTATVLLTKSNGFYDEVNLDLVANATVILTLGNGSMIEIPPVSDGVHIAAGLDVAIGEVLEISVTDGLGTSYNAKATVPHPVMIDSLGIQKAALGGTGVHGGSATTQYQVLTYWQDLEGVENYYRIKAIENNQAIANIYTLVDDIAGDGEQLFRPFFQNFEAGNTVTIQLLSIDESTYNYFTELSAAQGAGFNSTTPFNPTGNFEGALGYFGVIQMNTETVVLPE